ncbi:response regulator [Vibrio sinensis]|uniref:histidine kinase n=1 Tax=Vibrio sinensis TaxID=2302434 RepID=A0A3A6R9E3_9VIBR|nr:hybrid sensor histidine kinase/response regulator [Vibrio sinensis]RJX73712.1 response regulator [Vibrio sinensis]
MQIKSSLKRKSIFALAIYLALVLATVGSVSYFVVEPPVREQLERNLDLRTQVISSQIEMPLTGALNLLDSIVAIGATGEPQAIQSTMLFSLFSSVKGVTVSGGLWPAPYSVDAQVPYKSLFLNCASDGVLERVYSWDNPESGGYDQEDWYARAAKLPAGGVFWSQVYIDPFTHVQMITASAPYFVEQQFAGVATVDVSLTSFIEFVKTQAEKSGIGVVLRDSYGEVITEYDFQIMKEIYISQNQFGDFNWSIDVVNAKQLIKEQVFGLVSKVEASIIPIMLACVMMGYFLINRFLIGPIVLIAKKVGDSKESGPIDINYQSQDEIQHLIHTFNQKTIYLEQERKLAQASTRAKTAFLATLSHEIRTPMNGVLGTAQILLKTGLNDEQRKHLKTLYDSGEHMMTLLNEILDFSKIEQGHLELEKEAFALESIIGSINSIYFTLCSEKGLQFNIINDVPDNRWYLSDKARLRQVLFNLLNNAVKFTSTGYVEVEFKEQQKSSRNYLCIVVTDTGIGIEPEAQDKIFKPFEQAESSTTRRFGGTGLGLAIVKQICELMNGQVVLASEVGIGSRFEIFLEMETCTPGVAENKEATKADYSGLKALIVEDNRINAIIIETFMSNRGFDCTQVDNGLLALEKLQNHQFDLILMDNHMPVMDGVEATTEIRAMKQKQSDILILGCTADVFKETRDKMMAAGVNYIVPKPIDERELDDALHRFAPLLYQFKHDLTVIKSN